MGRIDHPRMVIEMLDARLAKLSQIREFMAGTADVQFRVLDGRAEQHAVIERTVKRLGWVRRAPRPGWASWVHPHRHRAPVRRIARCRRCSTGGRPEAASRHARPHDRPYHSDSELPILRRQGGDAPPQLLPLVVRSRAGCS